MGRRFQDEIRPTPEERHHDRSGRSPSYQGVFRLYGGRQQGDQTCHQSVDAQTAGHAEEEASGIDDHCCGRCDGHQLGPIGRSQNSTKVWR